MARGLDRNARAAGVSAALSHPDSEAATSAPADPSRSSAADSPATSSPGARTSVAQASKSSFSVIHRIMHNHTRGGRAPIRWDRAVLRILEQLVDANDALGFHDKAVADLFKGLEHHERTGALVRQTHV